MSTNTAKSTRVEVPSLKGVGYERWKWELGFWRDVCGISDVDQGSHVLLSLNEDNKEYLRKLKKEDIKCTSGVDNIINALDQVYLADVSVRKFYKFMEISEIRRKEDEGMWDFIIRFENLYREYEELSGIKDDTTKAFSLLRAAGLNEDDIKGVLTACEDVTYDMIRKLLKRRFCLEEKKMMTKFSSEEERDVLMGTVEGGKQQDDYQKDNRFVYNRRQNRGRGFYRGNRGRGRGGCSICVTDKHLTRDCPKAYWNKNKKEGEDNQEYTGFSEWVLWCKEENIAERTKGMAIIDTGCTRTVCGQEWIKDFVDNGGRIKWIEGEIVYYRFGNGNTVKSTKQAILDVKIGNERYSLRSNVVDGEVPLLLSMEALTRLKATINCHENYLSTGEENIELVKIKGGHLCLPLRI